MRYFRMFPRRRTRGGGEVGTPVDVSGNVVWEGMPFQCAGELVAEVVYDKGRTQAVDLVPCMTDELILSPAAAAVVRKCRLPDAVAFVPLRIVTRAGADVRRCVCVHFPEKVSLLNMDRSEFEYGWTEATKHIPFALVRGVLRTNLLRAVDLEYTEYARYVCSDTLRIAVQAANLKNFAFEELQCD